MRYKDVNSSLHAHIVTLRSIIGVLILINVGLWYGWHSARNDIRIHIPPDLRSGAVLKPDSIGPANVYLFAFSIYQMLNHWPNDGEKDYGQEVFRLASYLTPDFREYLATDVKLRGERGELTGRVRTIQPIPGQGYEERRVEPIDGDTWLVWIDYSIRESVRGMPVKAIDIRYPLRVVRYDVDPEVNPFGLALDGFGGDGPVRIEDDNQSKSSQNTGGQS